MSKAKKLLLFLLAAALCSVGCIALIISVRRLIRWGFGGTEHSKAVGLLFTAAVVIIPALLPASVYNLFRKRFEFTKDHDKTKIMHFLMWAAMFYAAATIASLNENILSLYEKRNVHLDDDERALGLMFTMLYVFIASVILTAVINAIINRKKSNFKEKNDV